MMVTWCPNDKNAKAFLAREGRGVILLLMVLLRAHATTSN